MNRLGLFLLIVGILLVGTVASADEPESPIVSMRQLTSGDRCGYPDWSPDGKWIVFISGMTQTSEGNLFMVPPEGGDWTQLTFNGGHHGVFSPDGRYVVFDAAFGTMVQVVSSSGGTPVRVVPDSVHIENSGNPCWSPDGTKLAFRSDTKILTVDLSSGEIAEVYDAGDVYPVTVQWVDEIPDSLLIVKRKPGDPEYRSNFYLVYIPTGMCQHLTESAYVASGSLSPDGNWLVYSATEDMKDFDLWLRPVIKGGAQIHLTSGPEKDMEPCWSPDGRSIVFTSNRGSGIDLWIMEIDMEAVEIMRQA